MPHNEPLPPAPAPQLFRFGLKHVFVWLSIGCVLFAAIVRSPGNLPMVIGVSAVLVGAHVFATMIGTRLRDASKDFRRWGSASVDGVDDQPVVTKNTDDLEALNLPTYVPLAEKDFRSVWTLRATVLGGAASSLGALLLMVLWPGVRPTIPGLIVGAFSCGIIGGWVGFLAGSFGPVTRHAWRHASQIDDKAASSGDAVAPEENRAGSNAATSIAVGSPAISCSINAAVPVD